MAEYTCSPRRLQSEIESGTESPEREWYRDLLRTAARDCHDRGWVPISIRYIDGQPRPVPRYLQWASSRPSLNDVISQFGEVPPDAIGIVIESTGLNWFDIDSKRDKSKVSRIVRCSPGYSTARGEQRLVRLIHPLSRTIDLRSGGLAGELRGGPNFSIIPPSIHRELPVMYRWRNPLPEFDGDLPILQPCELFSRSSRELVQLLVRRVGDDRSKRLTKPVSPNSDTVRYLGPVLHSNWVDQTMATDVGERRQRLRLLAHLMVSSKREWAEPCIDSIANEWWKEARKRGVTRDRDGVNTRLALRWLVQTYDPSLSNLINRAVAIMDTLESLEEVGADLRNRSSREAITRLATLCRSIDLANAGKPFFLSCRDAGRLTGVNHEQANRLLHRLVEDGWLRLIDGGTPGVARGGNAATYQWVN